MNTNMHGKKIEMIIFSGESSYQIMQIKSENGHQLSLSATYHGDHDQFWVVETLEPEGREIARYNPRLIETIIWDADNGT
jgi:hypothetical protein